MQVETGEALVLGASPFGEHDVLVHLLCPLNGRLRGLVKRGRHKSAHIQPFNSIHYERYRRLSGQLGTLDVDLSISRAPLWMHGGESGYVCAYLSDLLTRVLPEEQAFPGLFEAISSILDACGHGTAHWSDVVAFELFLLDALGYGLRLHDPVLAYAGDVIAYVSPRSGRSVGLQAAEGYEDRLIPLPAALGGPSCTAGQDCAGAFRLTGAFLQRALPAHAPLSSLLARGRLLAYYDRVMKEEDHATLSPQAA